jgi:hypothetical protein
LSGIGATNQGRRAGHDLLDAVPFLFHLSASGENFDGDFSWDGSDEKNFLNARLEISPF